MSPLWTIWPSLKSASMTWPSTRDLTWTVASILTVPMVRSRTAKGPSVTGATVTGAAATVWASLPGLIAGSRVE